MCVPIPDGFLGYELTDDTSGRLGGNLQKGDK